MREGGREGGGEGRTVDLLEHVEHALEVIVVQVPNEGILQVLFERHCEGGRGREGGREGGKEGGSAI